MQRLIFEVNFGYKPIDDDFPTQRFEHAIQRDLSRSKRWYIVVSEEILTNVSEKRFERDVFRFSSFCCFRETTFERVGIPALTS